MQILRAAKTAAEGEEGITPGLNMVSDPERALASLIATHNISVISMEVKRLVAGFRMTALAVMRAIEAYIKCDVAAEATLIIDELSPVLWSGALHLAEAKVSGEAL